MTGRTLAPTGFEDDRGEADPRLVAELERDDAGTPQAETALMQLVARSRWLVPVVTVRGEEGADTAVVTLAGPDGRRALPVFTGVQALAAWDPQSRPVPVTAERAAQAAVSEGCDVLVVDLASPHTAVLRASMVWALAQRRDWAPSHRDPFVDTAVAAAVAEEPAVLRYELEPGAVGSGALVVVLGLAAGLDAEGVTQLATRVGERLATDGELRARVDDLVFRIAAV